MSPITIVIIRHAISCANMYQNMSYRMDEFDPIESAIGNIPNPKLSFYGRKMCREYSKSLHEKLVNAGVDVDGAYYGCSYLQRTKETAGLLFSDKRIVRVPYITESGDIPVNQPDGGYKTSWPDALAYLRSKGRRTYILVSHGNFMMDNVWAATTQTRPKFVRNLDAILINGDLGASGWTSQPTLSRIDYDGEDYTHKLDDRCSLPRNMAFLKRLARRTRKQQHQDYLKDRKTCRAAIVNQH